MLWPTGEDLMMSLGDSLNMSGVVSSNSDGSESSGDEGTANAKPKRSSTGAGTAGSGKWRMSVCLFTVICSHVFV